MFETHRTILDSLYWPGGSTFLGGGLRSPVASVVFIAIVVIVTTLHRVVMLLRPKKFQCFRLPPVFKKLKIFVRSSK